jgi:hypothetical protein
LIQNWTNTVYLQAEILNVTFSNDIARVNATYTFKNYANSSIELLVLLPFANIPSNIHITRNGLNISFEQSDEYKHGIDIPSSLNLKPPDIHLTTLHTDEMIQFPLMFSGGENITVSISYNRKYLFRYKYFERNYYNEFRYIIGSTRWWNHTIDKAHFEFWIPKNEFHIGGMNTTIEYKRDSLEAKYTQEISGDFLVLSTVYNDWLPEEDVYLIVYWEKAKSFFEIYTSEIYLAIFLFILPITCSIGAISLYKIDRSFIRNISR